MVVALLFSAASLTTAVVSIFAESLTRTNQPLPNIIAEGRMAPSEAVRTTQWKYVRYPGESPLVEQLFNLKADPDETTNRISDKACATIADKMRQQLKAYQCNLAP